MFEDCLILTGQARRSNASRGWLPNRWEMFLKKITSANCTIIVIPVFTSSLSNSEMMMLQERRMRRERWSCHWPTRSCWPTSPTTSWSRPSGSSSSSVSLLVTFIAIFVITSCYQKHTYHHFLILMNMKLADLHENDCIKQSACSRWDHRLKEILKWNHFIKWSSA